MSCSNEVIVSGLQSSKQASACEMESCSDYEMVHVQLRSTMPVLRSVDQENMNETIAERKIFETKMTASALQQDSKHTKG